MRQQSRDFRLDLRNPLTRGIVFAGLGQYPGTVRYWDSCAGAIHGGRHGALMNMPDEAGWVPSELGPTVQMGMTDATVRHVLIPDFVYGPAFTVAFRASNWWEAGNPTLEYIFSHGPLVNVNSLNIYYDNGLGTLSFNLNGGDSITNAFTPVADFVHVAVTNDPAGQASIYIDGVLQGNDKVGVATYNPATDIYLGAREDLNNAREFGGRISEFLIYDRTLIGTEVLELSANPLVLTTPRIKTFSFMPPAAPPAGNPWYYYANQEAAA